MRAAQTWMSFPPPPNLPQSAQEVLWEPGKNSSGELTLSAEQPTMAAAQRSARTRRGKRAPIRLGQMSMGIGPQRKERPRRELGDDSERRFRQTLCLETIGGSSPRIHVIRKIKPRKKRPAG